MTAHDAASSRPEPQPTITRDLWSPNALGDRDAFDLGASLANSGLVSRELVESARRVHIQTPSKPLHAVLLDMGADEHAVMATLASGTGLDYTDPSSADVDQETLGTLGIEFCKSRSLIPIYFGGRLCIATSDALDIRTLDEVRAALGGRIVQQVIATPSAICRLLDDAVPETTDELDVQQLLEDAAEGDVEVVQEEDDDEVDDGSASPVVRYVNHVIQTAVREGASDIHVEPSESAVKIRFRIDGVLYEMMNPPRRMLASMTSRIKIMASLDIAERRLPQDGRIRLQVFGRPLDLRVSTAPTPHGEKTVMRLLDNRSIQVPLEDLGFHEDTLAAWRDEIAKPHGILLVTGPTGSGKTTTLYASMQELDTQQLNVSTVEDPVEYQLRGITQMQTHERIGLTFASSLRTLLRQDPDVIMIGEIRDHETATIAIQAALTGHLVLSTLHTNDAPSSVTRLINIGIEPFLVAGAVNGILAQRLMRRVCSTCAAPKPVSREAAAILDRHGMSIDTLTEGTGCDACRQTGLSGRLGIHEMLLLDDPLRDRIAGNPSVNELRSHCCAAGMTTLREDALRKMAAGKTTLSEVLRVTTDD
ncbi:MAG: GspE/PulE family protein [Phycisphaerales bacterium]|jgi:type IV pilus assembly protein PilB|nr:GspE/PulE family protein [Phycisphaerales bacterium]